MRFFMIFFGVACLTPLCLFSQTLSSGQSLPPGFVDGSKNPELIPDYASYRLVMIHLSSLNSVTPSAASHQAAVVRQIGLSDADT